MKIIILVLSLSFFSFTFAQNHNGEKAEINKVVQQFKESIIKKNPFLKNKIINLDRRLQILIK